MAISTTAVTLNEAVRTAAVKVEMDFQELSQTNSRPTKTVAQYQTAVTNLINALAAAGAVVTHA